MRLSQARMAASAELLFQLLLVLQEKGTLTHAEIDGLMETTQENVGGDSSKAVSTHVRQLWLELEASRPKA